MIYKIHTNNGERYSLEADYFTSDGSGHIFYKSDGGVVASFFAGEAIRVVPETAIEQAQDVE